MKAIIYSTLLFFTPVLLFAGTGLAQGDSQGGPLGQYVKSIIVFINNILFPLALAIAFIFLVWGIVKYFVIGGDSDDSQKSGKQMIIYSIAGFVIILSLYGIIQILTSAIGLGGETLDQGDLPTAPSIRS